MSKGKNNVKISHKERACSTMVSLHSFLVYDRLESLKEE